VKRETGTGPRHVRVELANYAGEIVRPKDGDRQVLVEVIDERTWSREGWGRAIGDRKRV
jgi:hypothetical protein